MHCQLDQIKAWITLAARFQGMRSPLTHFGGSHLDLDKATACSREGLFEELQSIILSNLNCDKITIGIVTQMHTNVHDIRLRCS